MIDHTLLAVHKPAAATQEHRISTHKPRFSDLPPFLTKYMASKSMETFASVNNYFGIFATHFLTESKDFLIIKKSVKKQQHRPL